MQTMTILTEGGHTTKEGDVWMNAKSDEQTKTVSLEFENVVEHYYQHLYKFAFSLTRCEADACDLTQQTFYTWQTKGTQLRDSSKLKSWLFTTLHRGFLQNVRRET